MKYLKLNVLLVLILTACSKAMAVPVIAVKVDELNLSVRLEEELIGGAQRVRASKVNGQAIPQQRLAAFLEVNYSNFTDHPIDDGYSIVGSARTEYTDDAGVYGIGGAADFDDLENGAATSPIEPAIKTVNSLSIISKIWWDFRVLEENALLFHFFNDFGTDFFFELINFSTGETIIRYDDSNTNGEGGATTVELQKNNRYRLHTRLEYVYDEDGLFRFPQLDDNGDSAFLFSGTNQEGPFVPAIVKVPEPGFANLLLLGMVGISLSVLRRKYRII